VSWPNLKATMLLVLAASGCASESEAEEPLGPEAPVAPDAAMMADGGSWQARVADSTSSVEDRIRAALEGVREDPCSRPSATQGCPQSVFSLGQEYVDVDPDAEAVLIIDELAPSLSYLRYRDRILGYYRVGDEGAIRAERVEVRIPTTLGTIITGFAKRPNVSARALESLMEPLRSAYARHVETMAGSHGQVVFDLIKERVPNHPLVLVSLGSLNRSLNRAQCDIVSEGGDSPDMSRLRQLSETFAGELRALIAKHNVRFINVSWGDTRATLEKALRSCGAGSLPSLEVQRAMLEARRPFYDVLFASPGVLSAHAAADGHGPEDAPFDQATPAFPNRLRIGAFVELGAGVPPEGAPTRAASWAPWPMSMANADVYVNGGVDRRSSREEGALSYPDDFGFGMEVWETHPQPSWVTPIALARMIALRGEAPYAGSPMSDVLIERMFLQLTCRSSLAQAPGCPFWDPLLHDQFERPER
jgi:hypothetical protein